MVCAMSLRLRVAQHSMLATKIQVQPTMMVHAISAVVQSLVYPHLTIH
jgi:hypothetical protein